MTEWQVVGVIVALIGLVASIVTPMLRLNSTIATLTAAVKENSKALERHEIHSREAHKRLHGRIDEVEDKVDDQESRLTALEAKTEKSAVVLKNISPSILSVWRYKLLTFVSSRFSRFTCFKNIPDNIPSGLLRVTKGIFY